MVTFCNEVMEDIKKAESEEDLIKVISVSMSRLRKERNSFNESGFIMNMIVTLRSVPLQDISSEKMNNIKLAIAIYRQFQKENPERIA